MHVINSLTSTMEDKKLSYDALKSVIKHMDANKRFEAVVRCPAIRKKEKVVPLKIDELIFHSNNGFQINNTHYTLNVIRKAREGTITPEPTFHEHHDFLDYDRWMERRMGESSNDFDQWGFQRPAYGLARTPGDIEVGDVTQETAENRDVTTYEWYKNTIRYQLGELKRNSESEIPTKSNSTKRNIDYLEKKLLAYEYRDKNITPPTPLYDFFIQLHVGTRKEGSREPASVFRCQIDSWTYEKFETLGYTKKLHEAMKYLLNSMFGERTEAIRVKHFEVANEVQIIRLTEGVKFHVHQLKCDEVPLQTFSNLSSYIDRSCLPIKHIFLNLLEELNSPLATNADEVSINSNETRNMVDNIRNLPCSKFNYMKNNWTASNGNMVTVIKNVLNSDKGIGIKYQFKFEYMNEIDRIFEVIESQMYGKVRRQRWNGAMTIPMNEEKELQLSYNPDNEYSINRDRIPSLIFKIEIMPKSDLSNIDNSHLLEAFRRSIR